MLSQSPADVSTGSSAEGQARLTEWMGGALCKRSLYVCVLCLCALAGRGRRSETAVSSVAALSVGISVSPLPFSTSGKALLEL